MKDRNQTGPTTHETRVTFGTNVAKWPPQVKE